MLEILNSVGVSSIDILGNDDVTDGSVDYYDFDWGEAEEVDEATIFAGCAGNSGTTPYHCSDPCDNWPSPCYPDPCPDPDPCPEPCPCPCPDPDPEPQPGPCTGCEDQQELPNDSADYEIIDL